MFGDMKIRAKLNGGFGLLMLFLVIMVAMSIVKMQTLADLTTKLYRHPFTVSMSIREATIHLLEIRMMMRELIIVDQADGINERIKKMDEYDAAVLEDLNILEERFLGDKKQVEDLRQACAAYQQARLDLIELKHAGKAEEFEAGVLSGKGAAAFMTVKDASEKIRDFSQDKAESFMENADKTVAQTYRLIYMLAGIILVSSVVISLGLGRSIATTLRSSVSSISGALTQISTTLEQHERTASQQSASVNETTTTMEELDRSSRQSATQADSATEKAQQVLKLADEGSTQIVQAQTATRNLQERVSGIAEQILKLSEQTSQIQGITALVTDLANQTNLLALNAAVEAARAGEHGKGFAVVATEIRKLADESKKSANRINTLVGDIQRATNSTVMVTEEGTKRVEEVIRIAQQNADVLGRISNSAGGASQSVQQISLNVQQQAAAIRQVVDAMTSLNIGAKETASGVRQTKEGVHNIENAARLLSALV